MWRMTRAAAACLMAAAVSFVGAVYLWSPRLAAFAVPLVLGAAGLALLERSER